MTNVELRALSERLSITISPKHCGDVSVSKIEECGSIPYGEANVVLV